MESKVSVCIISSPAVSHPSTILLDQVVSSLDLVTGLERATVWVIFDGYAIRQTNETKRGKVTEELAANYVAYKEAVREKYGSAIPASRPFRFVECQEHVGFAFAVKTALEQCGTPYCLVCQQDRSFMADLPCTLQGLVAYLEISKSSRPAFAPVRYVGLPTSTSCNHDRVLAKQYGLTDVLGPALERIPEHLGGGTSASASASASAPATSSTPTREHAPPSDEKSVYVLSPLIFQYDSNHLAVVDEYLKIFRPYRHLPETLRKAIGLPNIKAMLLKKGDFIEDRFGQQERNMLAGKELSADTKLEHFKWFGTFILLSSTGCTKPVVQHLRGRFFRPDPFRLRPASVPTPVVGLSLSSECTPENVFADVF